MKGHLCSKEAWQEEFILFLSSCHSLLMNLSEGVPVSQLNSTANKNTSGQMPSSDKSLSLQENNLRE